MESGARINQMLELPDKDFNALIVSLLNEAPAERKDRKSQRHRNNKRGPNENWGTEKIKYLK